MSIKKSIIAVFCAAACLTTALATPAYAAAAQPTVQVGGIMPLMEYISDANHVLTIQDGVAGINAYVKGDPSTATKCEITVELQEKGILLWHEYDSWSNSQNGRTAKINESVKVTPGNSYRLVTTVTVWSGNQSETRTLTSDPAKA